MTREETAEWVGYYFGLQRAVNMKRLPENFVQFLLTEMGKVEASLPPGTIDAWPRDCDWIAANRQDGPHIGNQ